MSYLTSKTAGDLWASLVYVVSENEKIDGFSAFSALVLAEAEVLLLSLPDDSKKRKELEADILKLQEIANIDKISMNRDMTITATKYPYIMTEIYKKQKSLLPICLKYKLIEFSDGTRFSGYGEGL